MKKSALYSDVLFAFSIVFVFAVCLFRYLGLSLPLALLCAVLGGVAVATLSFLHLKSKRQRIFLKKAEEKEKDKLLLHLALLSKEEQLALFNRVISDKKESMSFVKFSFSPLDAKDIENFVQRVAKAQSATGKHTQAVVYCNDMDDTAKALCERFQINVVCDESVYLALKEQNSLPNEYLGAETFIEKKKRQLFLSLSKNNSRRFLVGGSLILFTSLITPFPYYYLVCGSALLLFALLARIFGQH